MLLSCLLTCVLVQSTGTPNNLINSVEDFLRLTPEMKNYLDRKVVHKATDYHKYDQLLTDIFHKRGLGMTYSNARTHTPQETFQRGSGNCLSFTAMFVAMARYCGLEAQFQEVYDINSWEKKGDITAFNRHMNCVVFLDGRRKVVDFNFKKTSHSTWAFPVSDKRAVAHFFNNLGAEKLSKRNDIQAANFFERAIEIDPTMSFAWTNLGIMHRIFGNYKRAENCYLKALKLNKLDQTPALNLSFLYKRMGRDKEAAEWMAKAESFCQKSPYFHFEIGCKLFEDTQYEEAHRHFKKAVRLDKKQQPQFLFALAATYDRLGKDKKAQTYFALAETHAGTQDKMDILQRNRRLLAANQKPVLVF